MPDDAIPKRQPKPPQLELRGTSREDGQNGDLTIKIVNARHWNDVMRFADQNQLAQSFEACWARLIAIGVGYASAREPVITDGKPDKGEPGRAFTLAVHPEAFTRQSTPSFEWQLQFEGRPVLTGGMVFHQSDRTWSLHT